MMKERRNPLEAQTSCSMAVESLKQLQLSELNQSAKSQQKAVMLKLTDECSAAIQEAAEKRHRVRMHYTRDACIVEVDYENPDSPYFKRFSCVVQPIGNPVDAICYEKAGKRYRMVAPLDTKIQVKATEKTFDETREKTKKLIEEQQKRKTMDMSQQQQSKQPSKHRPAMPAPFRKQGSSSNLVSHKKPAHGISIKPSNALPPGASSNSSLRPPVPASKPSEHHHSSLPKPQPKPQIQQQSSERHIPATANTNLIPSSAPRTSPNNLPPPVSNQFKKRYFAEPDSSHMIARKKRNESGTSSASASGTSSTEVSPPNFYQQMMTANRNKIASTISEGSSVNKSGYEAQLPNGSLTNPTKPSKDWAQVYGEIESLYDAKKYHEIFSAEYPEYFECYKTLSAVAKEFMELESALKSTQIGTPNHNKMEEAIQSKFARYQQDEAFLSRRQKHADLRSKLDILKRRIANWENSHQHDSSDEKRKSQEPNAKNYSLSLSDMMVM